MKFRHFLFVIVGAGLVLGLGSCGACFYWLNRSAGPSSPPPVVSTPTTDQQVVSSAPSPSSSNSSSSGASGLTVGANGLRPMDTMIVDYLSRPGSGDKVKDAFPRERFKVSFYRDGSDPNWSRIKIDYNRNEKWDEKWTLENGQPAKRQVASKDDEQYDVEYRWRGGKWEAKTK